MNIMDRVDLTLLSADTTKEKMIDFVEKANKLKPYSICINNTWNVAVRKILNDDIKICNVIDFPLGASSVRNKVAMIKNIKVADEIDYVVNIGAVLSNDFDYIYKEAKIISDTCKLKGLVSKAIIETCYLGSIQIVEVSKMISKAGIDYVKTSTGMAKGGATIEDVKLISMSIIGSLTKIKASGGIKTFKQAEEFLKWCDRIGTSGLRNNDDFSDCVLILDGEVYGIGNKQMEEEIIYSMDNGY